MMSKFISSVVDKKNASKSTSNGQVSPTTTSGSISGNSNSNKSNNLDKKNAGNIVDKSTNEGKEEPVEEVGENYEYFYLEQFEGEDFDPFTFIAALPPADHPSVKRPKGTKLPKMSGTHEYTLVLDLDETLVHCSTEYLSDNDLVFPVVFNGVEYKVFVRKRPGFESFLEQVSKMFEVVVFTASQQIYADKLLNILDPKRKWITHRLFRDSCVEVDGNYLKDLSVLGRDLAKTFIVDNSPQAFGFHVDNGIPIVSWFEDKNDRELFKLVPFLKYLKRFDDVRPVIRKKFGLYPLIQKFKGEF